MSDTIVDVLQRQDWDVARKRLKRTENTVKLIKSALRACIEDPQVPQDIIRYLCSELRRRRAIPDSRLLPGPCRRYSILFGCGSDSDRLFERFCWRASVSTLEVVLEEPGVVRGYEYLGKKDLLDTICRMWRSYLIVFIERPTQRRRRAMSDSGHVTASPEKKRELLSVTSREDLRQFSDLENLWIKTEFLLKLSMTTSRSQERSTACTEEQERSLIHYMVQSEISAIVVWFYLRLHPHTARQRDHEGRLPLHYVVNVRNRDIAIPFKDSRNGITKKRALECVLDSFPDAAKHLDRDWKLPLTLLLEGDKSQNRKRRGTVDVDKIMPLIHAAPQALATRDRKSGCYPFMLVERTTLDATYTLIRENPAVLNSLIVTPYESYYERHLKKKLLTAENEMERMRVENAFLKEENERLARESRLKRMIADDYESANKKARG